MAHLTSSLQTCATKSMLDAAIAQTVNHEKLSKELEAAKKFSEKTIGEAQ